LETTLGKVDDVQAAVDLLKKEHLQRQTALWQLEAEGFRYLLKRKSGDK
jgi:hypothetical protein